MEKRKVDTGIPPRLKTEANKLSAQKPNCKRLDLAQFREWHSEAAQECLPMKTHAAVLHSMRFQF